MDSFYIIIVIRFDKYTNKSHFSAALSSQICSNENDSCFLTIRKEGKCRFYIDERSEFYKKKSA